MKVWPLYQVSFKDGGPTFNVVSGGISSAIKEALEIANAETGVSWQSTDIEKVEELVHKVWVSWGVETGGKEKRGTGAEAEDLGDRT